jgi:hypothetical protein
MERHEILEMMGEIKLSGMRAAYDEIVTHSPDGWPTRASDL